MKGIVLAGGTGSRLFPLTKITNKHLLPVGTRPMIYRPVQKLVEAGITDIMIVTGVEHMGHVVGYLGSGKDFGCDITYRVQDRAGGISEALGLAEHFVGNDKMVVILGDNIFEDSMKPAIEAFKKQDKGARIFLKQVHDPSRFGVATLEDGKVVSIEEKPENPQSDYAVTGVYCYDSQAFEVIRQCEPSARGELEITDVNNFYVKSGQCEYDYFKGWWTDAGTFESLKLANELVTD